MDGHIMKKIPTAVTIAPRGMSFDADGKLQEGRAGTLTPPGTPVVPLTEANTPEGWKYTSMGATGWKLTRIDDGIVPSQPGGCTVPPHGWRCSREAGHTGPCAIYDNAEQPPTDALTIVAEVAAMLIGGRDAVMPTPFQAGFQLACEEIETRLRKRAD